MPFYLILVSINNYFNYSNLENSILLIYICLDMSFKTSLFFNFLERTKTLLEIEFFYFFFSAKKY